MISPASYLPSSTRGMISSNGTTSVAMSGAKSFSARYAVVMVPGTAILQLRDFVQRNIARGHDHRPVTFADAAAAGHQRVLVLQVRIGVKRDRGDVVEAFQRFAIQGLDVAKRMRELHARHPDLVRCHAVKHEGIVRVRTVGYLDFANTISGIARHKNALSENLPEFEITALADSTAN